ncbi:MAG: GntR family transcriptional regulator [Proteobacteria bacterium]|nr:GntR family transcriptional regulator [Pseudomonadota bacterium]
MQGGCGHGDGKRGADVIDRQETAGDLTAPDQAAFVRRPRLASAVVDHLTHAIVTEVYPAGTSLPTESALCDIYKVSRTVIREVSTTLAEKGLVNSQQGRGTIVLDQFHWNMLDPTVLSALFQRHDGVEFLDNMIEIRTLLECSMAAKAARRIGDLEISELGRLLGRLEAMMNDPVAYAAGDIEFHNFIMGLSGDRLGRAIVTGLQGQALTTRGYSGHPTITDIAETHRAHVAIVSAIARHDAIAASAEMGTHIADAWRHRRQAPGTSGAS